MISICSCRVVPSLSQSVELLGYATDWQKVVEDEMRTGIPWMAVDKRYLTGCSPLLDQRGRNGDYILFGAHHLFNNLRQVDECLEKRGTTQLQIRYKGWSWTTWYGNLFSIYGKDSRTTFFSSIELNRIGRMKGRQTPHLIHLAFRSIDRFDGGGRTQADSRWMVVDGLEPRLNVTN